MPQSKPTIVPREQPILVASCPICGANFHLIALSSDCLDIEHQATNTDLVPHLYQYAQLGINIGIVNNIDGADLKIKYCEHVKEIFEL